MKKCISLIAAYDSKFGISRNNNIPWNVKQDLKHFYDKTTYKKNSSKINAVIMGKNSWKTIPDKFRGLKNRDNVVISTTMSEEEMKLDNNTGTPIKLTKSLNSALEYCHNNENIENIFICGGALIYKEALKTNIIDKCYITHILNDFKCDNFFPIQEFNEFMSRNKVVRELEDSDLNSYMIKSYEVIKYNRDECKYLELLKNILSADVRDTRNSPTYSIFGPELEFNLEKGFPLLTTKKMFWKGIVEELLFFLSGKTNTNELSNKGVKIWEPNTTRVFLDNRGLHNYKVGDMGPMYGWNWRHFGANYIDMETDYKNSGFDQLRDVIYQLKNNPSSRRIMMTTFDPAKVNESVLAPCHGIVIQFYVNNDKLDCKMYQRSADSFLGLPFNISSYSLLIHILCVVTGYKPGRLFLSLGDCHIYKDHKQQVLEQISREPYNFPQIKILKEYDDKEDPIEYIEKLKYEDFSIEHYYHHPVIKANMHE